MTIEEIYEAVKNETCIKSYKIEKQYKLYDENDNLLDGIGSCAYDEFMNED